MKRTLFLAAALAAAVVVLVPATASAATGCITVSTSKGTLTAAQVGGDVTGTLDASTCDIGVYYDATHQGSVTDATITGFTHYGVFVDGGKGDVSANVTDSIITNIGHQPTHNGGQYGVGVYYSGYTSAVSGTVSGNTVSDYQKGGIVVNGAKASAKVVDNTVTGLGPIGFNAQNGIQFYLATVEQLTGNTVSDNIYTQTGGTGSAPGGVGYSVGVVATGILLIQAGDSPSTAAVARTNRVFRNQADITIVN